MPKSGSRQGRLRQLASRSSAAGAKPMSPYRVAAELRGGYFWSRGVDFARRREAAARVGWREPADQPDQADDNVTLALDS